MVNILPVEASRTFGQGPFRIRRVRPGLVFGPKADPAFGPLAAFDHANLAVGTVVRYHEHVNDEILSYMWRGTMIHEDSSGNRIPLTPTKLMMMNAGKSFWHEESAPSEPVEMLQIFIRPREADLPGMVRFYDRNDHSVEDTWRLIAAPENSTAPLNIRQKIKVYDASLRAETTIEIARADGMEPLLYVFDGEIEVGGQQFRKGDTLAPGVDGPRSVTALQPTTFVLFLVDRSAPASLAGTISGD